MQPRAQVFQPGVQIGRIAPAGRVRAGCTEAVPVTLDPHLGQRREVRRVTHTATEDARPVRAVTLLRGNPTKRLEVNELELSPNDDSIKAEASNILHAQRQGRAITGN